MPQTTLTINGKDNASAAIGKAANSMKAFTVGYDLLKAGVKAGVDAIKQSVASYTEAEKIGAQTAAVIKSTGMAAGVTAKQVEELAAAMQKQTNFSDDQVQSAENLLLTFTKIGKDIFPEATKTVLNMSQALGQDTKSSAIQLGKALQDPIKGVTALSRVGVNFSESQKQMIDNMVKSGDTLGAQKIILKELETEFGGSAAAARDTFGGALQALKNNTDNVNEAIGKNVAILGRDFVEAMAASAESTANFLNSAEGIDMLGDVFGTIQGAVAGIAEFLKPLGPVFQAAFGDIQKAVSGLGRFTSGTNDMKDAMQLLRIPLSLMAVGIRVLGNTIANTINILGIMVDRVISLKDIFKALATGDFKLFAESVGNYTKSFKDQFGSVVDNAKDMVKDVATTLVDVNKAFDEKAITEAAGKAADSAKKEYVSKMKQTGKESGKALMKPMEEAATNTQEYWKNSLDEVAKGLKETGEQAKQTAASAQKSFDNMKNAAVSIFSGLQSISDLYYGNALANAKGNADEEKRIRQEQFTANKALAIGNTTISTAEAVMKAFTIDPTGILAAINGVMGAVQIGLIASQPMPAFARGGTMRESGVALVGERGPELVRLPGGSQVDSNRFSKGKIGGGITVNVGNIVAKDPIDFYNQMTKKSQRYEYGRA